MHVTLCFWIRVFICDGGGGDGDDIVIVFIIIIFSIITAVGIIIAIIIIIVFVVLLLLLLSFSLSLLLLFVYCYYRDFILLPIKVFISSIRFFSKGSHCRGQSRESLSVRALGETHRWLLAMACTLLAASYQQKRPSNVFLSPE